MVCGTTRQRCEVGDAPGLAGRLVVLPDLAFHPVVDLELQLDVGHRCHEDLEVAAERPAVEELDGHLGALRGEEAEYPGLVGRRGGGTGGPGRLGALRQRTRASKRPRTRASSPLPGKLPS